jgi:hypothetical protein
MSGEKSIVGKVEQTLDDLERVRQKKPRLFCLLIIAFVVVAGLYVFDKFWGIPALNKQITDQKEEIQQLELQKNNLVQSNNSVFQIQLATIQSYQMENAKLSRMVGSPEFSLKKRASILANEIFDFLQQWQKNTPNQTASEQAWIHGNSEEVSKAFMEDADKKMAYNRSMAAQFAKQFIGRLSTIRDQLNDLGLKTPKIDYTLNDNVRIDFEIQDAAEELQKLAAGISEQ